MSYLPQSNFGNCTQCPAKQVNCVKIGKSLVCLNCNRRNKTAAQIKKANERNAIRAKISPSKTSRQSSSTNSIEGQEGAEELQEMAKAESQWDWFLERRKEMTGVCAHCAAPTPKNNDAYFHFSIAHVLPKSKNSGFPSIAKHPRNWIELCPDCHQDFDNKLLMLSDLNCFDLIITRFQSFYPSIAKSEHRRIPSIFLNYVKEFLS